MALVEPLIGHLLSKYRETVLEGLTKIRNAVQASDEQGTALAAAITQQDEALQTIRATLLKSEYFVPTTQTLTALLTSLPERGSRVAFVREILRGDTAALFRKTLATLSDATLAHVTAAFQFLTAAVKDAPLLVLSRLRSPSDGHGTHTAATTSGSSSAGAAAQRRADVPLHLAAFRLQLTYSQRRIRLVRLAFLVQLITSPMHSAVAETVCSHGVLTHLLEDAAELLREGTSAGVACSLDALRVVRERFVQSRDIAAEQKRRVLLAQRNIFRLLVRALEFEPVADNAAAILYAIVDETIESPADYASTRVEALEDHGMPNYLLFFLLRQLRPKANERMAALVLHILQRAPDLIRPYFIRVSGHLAEEGSSHGVAPTTGRVAVINLMTRAFLCPMPYHLAARQVQLEPVAAKTSTFYTMAPRDVADEICPAWVAEYVHRLINGSTNLLLLTLAMQLTQAALTRAGRVLPLIHAAQRAAEMTKAAARLSAAAEREKQLATGGHSLSPSSPSSSSAAFSAADVAVLHGSDAAEAEVWDTFNAQVRHHLQAALPSREEFWHRMTQQLHRTLTTTATAAPTDAALVKAHVVTQRMLLLMKHYVDVLDVRVPWLSAVPAFLPDLKQPTTNSELASRDPRRRKAATPTALHPITVALQQHNDILQPWPAASVALLCELLVTSHQRRVPMVKLHHINMSQSQGIGEWPLLLSILLWVAHHSPSTAAGKEEEAPQVVRAVGWAAQLLLWTVHSVTVHSTCTLAEAHLWLTCLTPNTVPVFVHVLNHLLMRSLSKAADRVTHELREARSGVLVAAAEHFIERTKEKQQKSAPGEQADDDDAGGGGGSASRAAETRGNRPGKPQALKGKPPGETAVNLWGTHLSAALADFVAVVEQVRQRWPQRETALAAAHAAVQAEGTRTARVTRQQCIDVLVLADRQRGVAPSTERAATSPVQQLRIFARTLHTPVLPLPEEEAEMTLLGQLHGTVSTDHSGAAAVVEEEGEKADDDNDGDVWGLISQSLRLTSSKAADTAAATLPDASPRWYAMGSVCWHIAGQLLSALRRIPGSRQPSASGTALAARTVALRLLRTLLDKETDVRAVLAESRAQSSAATGLLVLWLSCVCVLLEPASSPAGDALSQAECDALGALCLDNYTGALSVQDRLCYAVCLSLHYLAEAPTQPVKQEGGDDADNMKEEEDAGERKRKPPQHHRPQQHRSATGAVRASQADEEPLSQRFRFYGAAVPRALVQRRFLLAGHSPSALRTAEVEMLSWHLDTLTEDDVSRIALTASSRLHNGLLARHSAQGCPSAKASGRAPVEDVLCAVYPELCSGEDAYVTDMDKLTSRDVLDLRYLVPLLSRVAALPAAYLQHVATGRVIPLLLKALTAVDASLRSMAAAALSTLYIPKGALRIVVGVARLKLRQLVEEARSRQTPPTQPDDSAAQGVAAVSDGARDDVPRLPTPLAIFLITAIRPLGSYEDALHHHLIHFFHSIEHALSTAVPLVKWTHTPPLTAISVPLMLERQEALQQRTHKLGGEAAHNGKSSIAQASAADVALELRKGIPPQLEFTVRLLRHACEVPQDAVALLQSDSLSGLMLLCDLLTASDAMRATYLRCLLDLCTKSATVTRLLAQQGNALVWTLTFLTELCKEYGTAAPYPYSGASFTTALRLLQVLCVSTLRSEVPDGAAAEGSAWLPCLSGTSVAQLEESLLQLRARVVAAHVTARDTLDCLDGMVALCVRARQRIAQAVHVAAVKVEGGSNGPSPVCDTPGDDMGKRPRAKAAVEPSDKTKAKKRAKVESAAR